MMMRLHQMKTRQGILLGSKKARVLVSFKQAGKRSNVVPRTWNLVGHEELSDYSFRRR